MGLQHAIRYYKYGETLLHVQFYMQKVHGSNLTLCARIHLADFFACFNRLKKVTWIAKIKTLQKER